ncbi:MAG TPA: molybdopterin cofactor-binding domain-containing protein [Vicinamibacterales bacterium]|jgi:CO/xanthine dehydrogenase Mo-binding subunit
MSTLTSLSRRDLLKAGGALIVTFAFDGALTDALCAQSRGPVSDPSRPLDPKQVDSFIAIHADGTVTVYSGKVDIGTGMRIAVAQMAGEELGISPSRITVIDGDTGLCPDQGGTGGSNGLTRGGMEIRRAAATARLALLARASEQLNRPAAELTAVDGEIRPAAGGPGVSIASLIGDRRLSIAVDEKAPLVDPAHFTAIGKPLPRPDVIDKCTARHVYVQDFSLPGMLHARVIRPPSVGATLQSFDADSLFGIPDVRVVHVGGFVAVVSKDEWAAVRAASVLKTTWSASETLPGSAELARHVREGAVDRSQSIVNKGDAEAAIGGAAKQLSATFFWPTQSHSPLGPSCAVADVKGNGATVWSSSQGTHGLRANLAKVFGLDVDKVRVVFLEGSGSYGTSGYDYAAADAVLISKTIEQPVRVQWSREDELRWDPKGPPQLLDLRAGFTPAGDIVAWDTQMWLPTTRPGARAYLAAEEAGIRQEHGMSSGLLSQNGDPPYDAANVRVVAHLLKETPLTPSNLRAPGKIANVFAVESFTDEIAAAAGVDPVAYRLKRMTDPRAIEVLTRATTAFGWQPRTSPNPAARQDGQLVGRGVAYMRYKQAENYVAMAMEIAVDAASGRIAVRRVVCAHDCGLVVNPDALKNQIEGCIVQTISRTLHEEVTFDRSKVTSDTFATYPILRFTEAPAVDVILIDRPNEPIFGAGEASTTPVPAAIGNAFYDATGIRLRTVPFTPARVKSALAAMGKGSTAH